MQLPVPFVVYWLIFKDFFRNLEICDNSTETGYCMSRSQCTNIANGTNIGSCDSENFDLICCHITAKYFNTTYSMKPLVTSNSPSDKPYRVILFSSQAYSSFQIEYGNRRISSKRSLRQRYIIFDDKVHVCLSPDRIMWPVTVSYSRESRDFRPRRPSSEKSYLFIVEFQKLYDDEKGDLTNECLSRLDAQEYDASGSDTSESGEDELLTSYLKMNDEVIFPLRNFFSPEIQKLRNTNYTDDFESLYPESELLGHTSSDYGTCKEDSTCEKKEWVDHHSAGGREELVVTDPSQSDMSVEDRIEKRKLNIEDLRYDVLLKEKHAWEPVRKPVRTHPTHDKRKSVKSEATLNMLEPVKSDGDHNMRKPVKSDDADAHNMRKPMKSDDTHNIRKPIKIDDTNNIRKPIKSDDTHNIRKPIKSDDTHNMRKPIKSENTHNMRKPTKRDDTHNMQKPVSQDESHDLRWPVIEEESDLRNIFKEKVSDNDDSKMSKIDPFGCTSKIPLGEEQLKNYHPASLNILEVLWKEAEEECGDFTNMSHWYAITPDNKWSWMVSLLEKKPGGKYRNKCSAALINDQWVLTVAHCVDMKYTSDFKLLLGNQNSKRRRGKYTESEIDLIVIHKDYKRGMFENDLALLRMTMPIEFSNTVKPICLPEDDEPDLYIPYDFTDTEYGIPVFLSWRHKQNSDYTPNSVVPLIENSECAALYSVGKRKERIKDTFICAGKDNGNCDSESGSSLVAPNEDDKWMLIGLVSWGSMCSNLEQPSVYIRITSYVVWIRQMIACYEIYY